MRLADGDGRKLMRLHEIHRWYMAKSGINLKAMEVAKVVIEEEAERMFPGRVAREPMEILLWAMDEWIRRIR